MAILTRPAILERIRRGDITIDPLDESAVGPNSIDLRLGAKLLAYNMTAMPSSYEWLPAGTFGNVHYIDMKQFAPTDEYLIPEDGCILMPGRLYLASTLEWTETKNLVPYLDGKSSVGRLGVSIHCTAGRGDCGFTGRWTMEITCVHPVRVYAGRRIAQLTFHTVEGEPVAYRGRYLNDAGPAASRLWQGEGPSC